MCGADVTSGLSVKPASSRVSGTTRRAPPATACAQNERSRAVSRIGRPIDDLNHCRCSSTSVMAAIGVSQQADAASVRSSNEGSGSVSRMPYRRSAARRSRSSWGSGAAVTEDGVTRRRRGCACLCSEKYRENPGASKMRRMEAFGGADLHCHSTFSDGVESPASLVQRALEAKLSVLALSDHDALHGLPEFEAAAKGTGLVPVHATELSTRCEGEDVHLLGLFVDTTDDAF